MSVRHLTIQDDEGRAWRVAIPAGADDSLARLGARIGPPDLTDLARRREWSPEFARALHDQLAARGLWTRADIHRAGGSAALQRAVVAAARADVHALLDLYAAGPRR